MTPKLNAAGFRTIVPTLRRFGVTRFTCDAAPRTGNSGILAMDAVALLDRLRMALLSSPPRLGGMATPSFARAQRQWYHWFQATRRGAEAIRRDCKGFARII